QVKYEAVRSSQKQKTSCGSRLAASPLATESKKSAKDIKVELCFVQHISHGYLVLREFIKSRCIASGVTGVDQPKSEVCLDCVEAAASHTFLSRFRVADDGVGPEEQFKMVQKAIRNQWIDSIKHSKEKLKCAA
ncbi:hypothetical protein Q9L58_010452, partial [Maublancomyces gigas]